MEPTLRKCALYKLLLIVQNCTVYFFQFNVLCFLVQSYCVWPLTEGHILFYESRLAYRYTVFIQSLVDHALYLSIHSGIP